MNHEQHIALREAHSAESETAYFNARPEVADTLGRRIFAHAFHRGFDKAAEVLRDLSWVPPPGQQHGKMFPALYLLHPDGSTSLAANEDIITVADALRPAAAKDAISVPLTIDAGPAREVLAGLAADLQHVVDAFRRAGGAR